MLHVTRKCGVGFQSAVLSTPAFNPVLALGRQQSQKSSTPKADDESSSNPSTSSVQLPALPTPIRSEHLRFYLEGYDPTLHGYIMSGFLEGFRIQIFGGQCSKKQCKNLLSAASHPEVIDHKPLKESQVGRIAGPFEKPPFDNLTLSPLDVVQSGCRINIV